MNPKRSMRKNRFGVLFVLALFALLLAGCEPAPIPEAATSTPEPPAPTATLAAGATAPTATPRASADSPAPAVAQPAVQTSKPVAVEDAAAPSQLSIPEIGLEVPVVSMAWQVTEVAGKRTTAWVLPGDALGWQSNSVGAGAAGNLVISGHQLLGEGLLAPIALGEVAIGQEILVTDAKGAVFVYQVSEVSEPIAISEDLADEESLAATWTAQSGDARLTLITGWPDFSSTHRIFVTALFVGVQP
jgi:sortase (surface protein transpeptidase)